MDSTLLVGLALGMRHGIDPDHLTAIDGLCRLRPCVTNGLYFALGHGLFVTLLAVGIGKALSGRAEFLDPWLLIAIGVVTLWSLRKPSPMPAAATRPLVAQPFLLGMILAAGFETASQLSAFALAGQTNPLLLGAAFIGGIVLVEGIDDYLGASAQNLASRRREVARLRVGPLRTAARTGSLRHGDRISRLGAGRSAPREALPSLNFPTKEHCNAD